MNQLIYKHICKIYYIFSNVTHIHTQRHSIKCIIFAFSGFLLPNGISFVKCIQRFILYSNCNDCIKYVPCQYVCCHEFFTTDTICCYCCCWFDSVRLSIYYILFVSLLFSLILLTKRNEAKKKDRRVKTDSNCWQSSLGAQKYLLPHMPNFIFEYFHHYYVQRGITRHFYVNAVSAF